MVTNGDCEGSNISYIGLDILFQYFSLSRRTNHLLVALRGVDILLNEQNICEILGVQSMKTGYMNQRVD